MPYIYKITNQLNQKIYIGKTQSPIKRRWNEHLRNALNSKYSHRPLYVAMSKYGSEHFEIEILEECPLEQLEEREIFWIQFLNSYKYGYNATKGGDGKRYCDYDLIFSLFEKGHNNKEIQKITKYDKRTITVALESKGITREQRVQRGLESIQKPVAKLDLKTKEIVKVYPSVTEAYIDLGKRHSGHIASVCQGKRQSAYGFSWRYL